MHEWIDETEIIAELSPNGAQYVLADVGAHHGDVTVRFLGKGWSVIAYEPDPTNRLRLEGRVSGDARVQVVAAAVSDAPAAAATLFTSPISTGISSLAAFAESHHGTTLTDVVTLAQDLPRRHIERVDFLKIDIEGFDLPALRGFDWTLEPRYIVYEFEDRKTVPLGYTLSDSSDYVARRGYHLIYSVWEPITQYGTRHRWRGLFRQPPPDAAQCWGNVLCFCSEEEAGRCLQRYSRRSRRVLSALSAIR